MLGVEVGKEVPEGTTETEVVVGGGAAQVPVLRAGQAASEVSVVPGGVGTRSPALFCEREGERERVRSL